MKEILTKLYQNVKTGKLQMSEQIMTYYLGESILDYKNKLLNLKNLPVTGTCQLRHIIFPKWTNCVVPHLSKRNKIFFL